MRIFGHCMGEFIILAEGSPGDVHLKERVHAGADEKENSNFFSSKKKNSWYSIFNLNFCTICWIYYEV